MPFILSNNEIRRERFRASSGKRKENVMRIVEFTVILIAAAMALSGGPLGAQAPRVEPGQVFAYPYSYEATHGGRTITGAPYTATEITETRQTLADGTHIDRKFTAKVARDSQGRTREERSLNPLGPLTANSQGTRQIVTISDPVAGKSYALYPDTKTAIVRPLRQLKIEAPPAGKPGMDNPDLRKVEDLGTQLIEGLSAKGRRETTTIPVGQIGNDKPIEIVSETWSSRDLRGPVLRKRNDPRAGQTTFRVTNIKLSEPDPPLFGVPSDYSVRTEPPGAKPPATSLVPGR
jgi:hypothetical protein